MSVAIARVIGLLEKAYGRPSPRRGDDPLSVLVKTILSQNTSDTNSDRAFANLQSFFGDWEKVVEAEEGSIAEAIRTGGLGNIKARRLKEALGEIKRRRGRLTLEFLNDMPLNEAREWLKSLPGVGNKTAGVVLLFALGRPVLPVDTHIFRVSGRLGLIGPRASLDEAHRVLEKLVPARDVYAFHLLMIEHGRRTCAARNPRCRACVLGKVCPSYDKFMLGK